MSLFQKSQEGQRAYSLPKEGAKLSSYRPPDQLLRKEAARLPELSELDLTRHFLNLARKNMSIDTHFYPLGSCTMKLNPRVNEWAASLPRFVRTHPLAPDHLVQGNLRLMCELTEFLSELCGMEAGNLAPNAGAQGEFVGAQMIAAYHKQRKDHARDEMLVPDNAHGTNPATASMVGLKTVVVRTNSKGDIDLNHLKELLSERTAGLMLTNPNTLGLFSPVITQVAEAVHLAGGLLYYDGANLNPLLNVVRIGQMGFDVMHINLHKTFSTPHGGGGPGAGPVLCRAKLAPFLPLPHIISTDRGFQTIWESETSIGQIASFHGNFAIYLRAYLYIKLHGHFGLRRIAEQSVLNANYLKERLGALFTIPFSQPCMHEFVVQADRFLQQGVRALDLAKRLLDYGIHAPTVYFPLIIKECMLIEPTETESKATLDRFIEVMEAIAQEALTDPELVKSAPHTLPVSRLDEVLAAREPILRDQAGVEATRDALTREEWIPWEEVKKELRELHGKDNV